MSPWYPQVDRRVIHWLVNPGIKAHFKDTEKRGGLSKSSLLSAHLGPCLMEEQGPIQVNKLFLSYYFIRLDKQRRRFPEFRNSEWVQERSENVWKQPVKRMTSWAKTASPWVCVASPQQVQVTCGRAEHLLPWPSNGEGGAQGEC